MMNKTPPLPLYTCEQVRALDNYAIASGIPGIRLMKRAGRALFDTCRERWPMHKTFLVFCGAGNNAGDGYVLAALAAQKNLNVKVVALREPESLCGDAQLAYQYALQEAVGITAWNADFVIDTAPEDTLVVDALLGTGTNGEPRGAMADAIEWINRCESIVVSADLPSGLNADTGYARQAVRADLTLSFVGRKRGLYTGAAPAFTGELCFDNLNIPADVSQRVSARVKQVKAPQFLSQLKGRPADAHKGHFGHVMIIGGDHGFGGAVALAAEAALHSGAGLVSVATQPQHVAAILTRSPELMVSAVESGQALGPLLLRPSVIVIGPGLGQSAWSEQMMQKALTTELPLVVDADGLNILAKRSIKTLSVKRENWILTPHPGEAARLLNWSGDEVQRDRFTAVEQIQKNYGGVAVLKGAGTLISSEEGTVLAKVGNPGMAVAGMGDILAGVCGALLAQHLPSSVAAGAAVCVHGDAGDRAASKFGQRGLRATELLPYIRQILNSTEDR